MRIGLIIYEDLDYPSGGFLYDKKLVNHLEDQGHDVEIISMPWLSYFKCLLQNFDSFVFQRIKDADLDVLLQDELNHPSLFLLNHRIRSELGLQLVSIVHHLRSQEEGGLVARTIYQLIEKRYLNSVDAIIANSMTTLATVTDLLRKKLPTLVANPGADRFNQLVSTKQIKKRAHIGAPLNILFLGALIKRKAPHLILVALRDLPSASYSLFFAGSPDSDSAYARSLKDYAKKNLLDHSVQFLGHLPEGDLIELFKKSHVLIVPSSYEGYGIAFAEAMAFGLPVIARNLGATGEIIRHNENGYLLESGNSQEIAKIFAMLHNDRDLLLQLSLSASDSFKEMPTWSASMNKIEKFLIHIHQTNPATSLKNG